MFPVFSGLESHGDFAFGAVSGKRAALLTLRRSTLYLRWGGGGIYVCAAPKGMVWGHFGLETGTVFERTTGACERQKKKKSPDRRLVCIVLIPNERTKLEICENVFSNPSNDNNFRLKARSENGYGF